MHVCLPLTTTYQLPLTTYHFQLATQFSMGWCNLHLILYLQNPGLGCLQTVSDSWLILFSLCLASFIGLVLVQYVLQPGWLQPPLKDVGNPPYCAGVFQRRGKRNRRGSVKHPMYDMRMQTYYNGLILYSTFPGQGQICPYKYAFDNCLSGPPHKVIHFIIFLLSDIFKVCCKYHSNS